MSDKFKISKDNVEDILSLSPMQESIIFHYIKDSNSDLYFEQIVLVLEGDINTEHFKGAWKSVICANEMLRTVYRWHGLRKPVQIVLKDLELPIKFYDYSAKQESIDQIVNQIENEDRPERIDLESKPFRIKLFKINNGQHVMVISYHHVILDGWSISVILREFFEAYRSTADLSGISGIQSRKKTLYKHYLNWIKNRKEKGQADYWAQYVSNYNSSSAIRPTLKSNSDRENFAKLVRKIPADVSNKLLEISHKYEVTFTSILYFAWGILLQRYNGCEDVIFGTTVSGRPPEIPEIENMVGLFVNTVPMRVKSNPYNSIIEEICRIHAELTERKEYEYSPYSGIARSRGLVNHGKLFDTIVAVENYPVCGFESNHSNTRNDLRIVSYSSFETTNFSMVLEIMLDREAELHLIYNSSEYNNETANRVLEHYNNILQSISNDVNAKVSEILMTSAAERKYIIETLNNTDCEAQYGKTIQELF